MRARNVDGRNGVAMEGDSLDRPRAFGADGSEFEAADLLQRLGDVSQLRGEVVVNEKDSHRHSRPSARGRRCAGPPNRIRRWPAGRKPYGPSDRNPALVDGRLVAVGEFDRYVADGENLVV